MKICAVFVSLLFVAYSANAQLYCNSTTSCSSGASCWTSSPCKMGWCACNSGYKQDNTQTSTVACIMPSLNVGANCTTSTQCTGQNTACSGGVCSCAESNMVPNSGKSDCVYQPAQQLNAACDSMNSNCSAYAFCNGNSVCQCNYGYIATSNKIDCVPLQPNNLCSNSTNCPPGYCSGATCSSGTYQCISGYTWATVKGTNLCTNATFTAGSAQSCNYNTNSLCSGSLQCDTCPENAATYICLTAPSKSTTYGPSGGAAKQELTTAAVVALTAITVMLCLA
jgi:hypothetical protein